MRVPLFLIVMALPGLPIVRAETVVPASMDIKTEAGLRAELDRLEARYEAACVKLGEASWDARKPGFLPASAAVARDEALKELAAIQTDPKLGEIIAYWIKRNTVTSDPTLMRRVVLWNKIQHVSAI